MLSKKIPNIKNCGLCEKDSQLSFQERHGEYSLYECSNCGGQFWSPMKNPGAEWYEKDVRYSFRNLNPLKKPEINHKEFLRDAPAAGGRLLDIGMGTGNFLAAAVSRGYDGYGIDFDRDAIAAAREFLGLKNVYVMDIDGALKNFYRRAFDAITLFEVLEHLEDPSGFIEKVGLLLKPGGYLAISVPYRGSPDFLKTHDKPPRHLSRWSEDSITNFLKGHNFSVVRVKIIPIFFGHLITRFHFWCKGFLSFNAVQKMAYGEKSGSGAAPFFQSRKIIFLQRLARVKDYILFSIPVIFLYIYLFIRGRYGLGLYVLAKINKVQSIHEGDSNQ